MSEKKQINLLHKISALHRLIEKKIRKEFNDDADDFEGNMEDLQIYYKAAIDILNEYYDLEYSGDFYNFLPYGLTYRFDPDINPFTNGYDEYLLEEYKLELARVFLDKQIIDKSTINSDDWKMFATIDEHNYKEHKKDIYRRTHHVLTEPFSRYESYEKYVNNSQIMNKTVETVVINSSGEWFVPSKELLEFFNFSYGHIYKPDYIFRPEPYLNITEISNNDNKTIGDEEAILLSEALLSSKDAFIRICLVGNNIKDKGAKALALAAQKNRNIISLDLSYNPILDLSYNPIKDEGVLALAEVFKDSENIYSELYKIDSEKYSKNNK